MRWGVSWGFFVICVGGSHLIDVKFQFIFFFVSWRETSELSLTDIPVTGLGRKANQWQ